MPDEDKPTGWTVAHAAVQWVGLLTMIYLIASCSNGHLLTFSP